MKSITAKQYNRLLTQHRSDTQTGQRVHTPHENDHGNQEQNHDDAVGDHLAAGRPNHLAQLVNNLLDENQRVTLSLIHI